MTTNEENMSTALTTLTRTLATKLDMGDGADLIHTLKATAFKGDVTDAQMTALLVVANQYGLNPWVKEIFAFPDKQNGIVPVVGVDGWSRIMNEHPQFDGMEFEQDDQSCTCIIYRKDRSRPVRVTEFMAECKRGTGPWSSHPRRMLRHKAMIQCARLAFGFGGIYDQDEAERIVEAQPVKHMGAADVVEPATLPVWPADKWAGTLPRMVAGIQRGKSVEDALAWLRAKGEVTPEQEQQLRDAVTPQDDAAPAEPADIVFTYAQVADRLTKAADMDRLAEAGSLINAVADAGHRKELVALYEQRATEMEA